MIKPSRPTARPPPAASEALKEPRSVQIGEQIGHQLRALFEDVVAEPVPERLRALLEELERKSRRP